LEAMLMRVNTDIAMLKVVATLLVMLTLLVTMCGVAAVKAQDESTSGIIRHSPGIITKILTSNLSLQQLSELLNSTNVDALLGDEGLGNGVLNVTNVVNSLADNPEVAAQLTSNDVAKLSALTTQGSGQMPSDLRIDLSLLASLAKDPALREVLKEWALTGNVDLRELKNKVDISSLSPEDLAILKSALGLAAKYGLISPTDVKELGLSNLTPEDLRAIAGIAERLASLSKDPRTAELLEELAKRGSELSLSGNLTPKSLSELMSGLGGNASLPYVIKLITDGLGGLTQAPGVGVTPIIPKVPELNLPSIHSQVLSPQLSTTNAFSFFRVVLASIIGVLLLYLVSRLLKERARYLVLSTRKGKAIPKIMGVSGVNASIIRAYWDAVALLSALVPLSPSETHREYLRKVRSVAGTAFEQLTKIYELARWSGQKLDEKYVITASRLVEALRSTIRRSAGGGGG